MKKLFSSFLLILAVLMCQPVFADKKIVRKADICVYGGTAAGVIAAYSAKKMGKSVLLIEPGKYLGGMTTGGLGYTDIGNKYAISGLSKLFYRRVGQHYNKFEQWTFPPSVATKEIHRFVKDADVEVLYFRRIVGADKKGKAVKSILLEDSNRPGEEPLLQIEAKAFIDCSYEGDLMARAGVSYFVGREDNSLYDETLNGVQMLQHHQFPDGIDPYKIEGDPSSGLCWGISTETLDPNGTGDKKIQAYNYRLCLTRNKDNRRPFEKPANYDPSMYELIARASEKMPKQMFYYLAPATGMPEDKCDTNNSGPLSSDMIGMNYDYPEAGYQRRAEICKAHEDYTKGYLYFLSHDERLPQELRDEVNQWGYAKDEFTDTDNFPPQLYVREARRLHGEYVMTQHNCQGDETVGDGVGMAAYGMDSHNCQRIIVDGMVKNEGDVQYHGFAPFPIAYRSIIPQRAECSNLLVPVCMSATHIAYGSIRMEPVFMMLAQSAAVAAVMAIDGGQAVQDIDVVALRRLLKENPYLDNSTPEILIDDTDIDKIAKEGWSWIKKTGGQYKTFFEYALNGQNPNIAYSILPRVKTEGRYSVYYYCPGLDANSLPETMVFDIKHADGQDKVRLNPRGLHGQWMKMGTFRFDTGYKTSEIKLNIQETNGPLFFDALVLVPEN